MTRELEGKKLLILGGNPETTPLVKIANDMMTSEEAGRCDGEIRKWWQSYREDAIRTQSI